MEQTGKTLHKRIETEVLSYISGSIELSPGVHFSQYKLINRIYRFRNRDLSGTKINPDLSYNYYFDIISPRADSEIKNLRFDTKNILVFSQNPRKDFAAVFISNAKLKDWMADNGEDIKLKSAVEEFTSNGNIGFKRIKGGYEIVDPLNTYITNEKAETIDDTNIIERHELTASQIKAMTTWNQEAAQEVIEELGDESFTASANTTPIDSATKRYEIFEYTGEVSIKEFKEAKGEKPLEGDEHEYILAKVICAGLKENKMGKKYTLFAEKLAGKLSDHYIYAHRGKYEGRFWRVGMYELLFDHQIRANEIGNQLATGLEWASRVVFRSSDSQIMTNIRADLDNGDIIIAKDLAQVDVRLHGMDQLIADWNRLAQDADRLSNALDVVRGENLPSGTPFRMGALLDQNAGKMFAYLRQKITLPYKRVFKNWVLPQLVTHLKGEDIIRLVGDTDILDQFREIMAESWYAENLVRIGPHTREIGEAIKQEKIDELRKIDPVIKNAKEIWEGVLPRFFVTITGENSDLQDQIQDLMALLNLEQDPERINWILDTIYKSRGIPIPPKREQQPADPLMADQQELEPTQEQQRQTSRLRREAETPVVQ